MIHPLVVPWYDDATHLFGGGVGRTRKREEKQKGQDRDESVHAWMIIAWILRDYLLGMELM